MKRCCLYILILLLLAVPCGVAAEETPTPADAAASGGETSASQKKLEVVAYTIEQGVIINIEIRATNCKMAGYYFGVIDKKPAADNHDWVETSDLVLRMTKWPDTYYFWVRDTEGNAYGPTKIELSEDYYHTYLLRKNTEWPKMKLSQWLPEHGSSVEEANTVIAEAMAKAGAFTREGVVVGVMTQISFFQERGIQIPFFDFGNYPFREASWYLNPDWGYAYGRNKHDQDIYWGRTKPDVEAGTNCSGFVHYAFRLAGIITVYTNKNGDAGGILGKTSKRASSYSGLAGDVLTSRTHHEMLLIDKYDDNRDGISDGYIVAESAKDTGGIGYKKHDFKTYSRFCDVWNMDGAFYNTAQPNRNMMFWNSYHAPKDSWPDFFKKAVEEYTRYQVVYVDAYGVNERFSVGLDGTVTPPQVRNNLEAKKGYWNVDLTGVSIRGNYVIEATYTEEDGGISWLEEISRTPEPTPEPTPTPTPTPVPTPTPEPTILLPVVEVAATPVSEATDTPEPAETPESTEAPVPAEPEAAEDNVLLILLIGASALVVGLMAALVVVLVRRRAR